MQIVHYNHFDFDIDPAGRITRKSTWHVMPDRDVTTDWTAFGEAVKTWAGKLGDAWRLPTANSQDYTTDNDYVVTAISCKARARYMYEVTFTGQLHALTATQLGQTEITVNDNGEKEKSARWLVHADSLDAFLPRPGDVLSWAGELYLCGQISCRDVGGKRYEVSLRARDMAVLQVGLPTFKRTALLESVKTAKWRVAASAYDEFLAAHDVDADASSWAGDGYYVTSVSASPIGKCGYYVTLEAKHIAVRLIDVKRAVRFLCFNNDGSVANEVIYTGRWQVHKDSLDDFNVLSGTSAADWADDGFIVTAIEPTRLSATEYQITLTARSPACQLQFAPIYDDRSNLSARKDVKVDLSEFKLTPEQCGWTQQNGSWIKLNKLQSSSWTARYCPLTTSTELDWSLTQTPLRTTTVAVTEYKRGQVSLYVKTLAEWNESDILNNYTLCNDTGSWRKLHQESELILDNLGKFWTKITRHYQKAPGSFSWNASYAGFKKTS